MIPKSWFYILLLTGIIFWLNFYLLTAQSFPPTNSSEPLHWEIRTFQANDWGKEIAYNQIIKDAFRHFTIPFHIPELGSLFMVQDRFLGAPIWTMSFQIILLTFLSPMVFCIINHILMFLIGSFGLWMIIRHFSLGVGASLFLFALFHFNGYFVEKVTAYGPGQMGYYLLPFFFYVLLRINDIKKLSQQGQLYWGCCLGLILGSILWQGSLHFFVQALTFLIFFALAKYSMPLFSLTAITSSVLIGAVRLLPAAVTFGKGANPHDHWGYFNPIKVIKSFLVVYTQFDSPGSPSSWWEWGMYISIFGFVLILIFGVTSIWKKRDWMMFKNWNAFYLPFFIFIIISIWRFRKFIIPDFIPLLNAEGTPARYIIFPLLLIVIIASINLEGYWRSCKAMWMKWVIGGSLFLLMICLWRHAWFWRMHYIENEYMWAASQGLYGAINTPIALSIHNNNGDLLYMNAFWFGLVLSIIAFFVNIGMIRKFRKDRIL